MEVLFWISILTIFASLGVRWAKHFRAASWMTTLGSAGLVAYNIWGNDKSIPFLVIWIILLVLNLLGIVASYLTEDI